MPMQDRLQEHSLSTVLDYFTKGFQPREGEEVVRVETVAVDTTTNRVVFRILTREIGRPTPAEVVEDHLARMEWDEGTPEEVRELVRQNVRAFAFRQSKGAE